MRVIVVPCLIDNFSYLLVDDDGKCAAVVDPGEAWPIMRDIERHGLQLTTVLCTHHHQDHIGGLDDLLDAYQGLQVLGHRDDRHRIPRLTVPLADNDRISVCGLTGQVSYMPGHTATSIMYRFADHLFVGDTLFGAGCGRLFEGTAAQLQVSLAKIVSVGPQAKVYVGHEYTINNLGFAAMVEPGNHAIEERLRRVGETVRQGKPSSPVTVADELQTNPFLRTDVPEVITTLKSGYGLSDESQLSVFSLLRALRNDYS